ncbi:MAG: chorismate mutase, partial [Thermoguttaceae bacterium]
MEKLEELRKQISSLDNDLADLLVRRMDCSLEIAKYKKEHNMQVLDPSREREILSNITSH